MDASVNVAGMKLKNPVIAASGTFGYGVEFAAYGDLKKLGGIAVKGLSLQPREGNPMPRIAETPCGMLNAVGIQNIGVERFVSEKLPQLPWRDTAIIANLYAKSPDEFAELAARLAGVKEIAGLEVNISCPNVAAGGSQFGQDPGMAATVTEAVMKNAGDKPVIVKLSPNVTDITVIARACEASGASALSLINTITGMAVDIRTRRPRLANVVGGLSGPAIKPVGLRMVYQVCRAVEIPVIGLGGITTAEDVLEYILVGAHAVQVGTGNFMRPDLVFNLMDEVTRLMAELEITSLDEFRGKLSL